MPSPATILNPEASAYQTMPPLITQPRPPPSQLLPTVAQLATFLSSHLPPRAKDVDFLYHTPNFRRKPSIFLPPQSDNPESSMITLPPLQPKPRQLPTSTTPVPKLIFSITPTPGVYTALSSYSPFPALAFLHRPFLLDRRAVPRGVHVLSSHTSFDEVLTVGYNTVLAARVGMDLTSFVCLKGYKGDPERKIGIVGAFSPSQPAEEVLEKIKHEFGTWDSIHGFEAEVDVTALNNDMSANSEDGRTMNLAMGDENDVTQEKEQNIKVVAIMNAFHPEEVSRVLEAAFENNWISSLDDGKNILYLTGQAREPGLLAAMEKGMKVVCVGHRVCEEWGIKYLAQQVERKFPAVNVLVVMEEEEVVPKIAKVKKEMLPPPKDKSRNKTKIKSKKEKVEGTGSSKSEGGEYKKRKKVEAG